MSGTQNTNIYPHNKMSGKVNTAEGTKQANVNANAKGKANANARR